jgi:hypothetical protein
LTSPLIAFSCTEIHLMHRLETAFADELATRAGQVSLLVCLGEILNLIEKGSFPPRPADQP